MNNLKKAYYLLRYLGPQIIWLRAGVYLRKGLGVTARVYGPRPWEQMRLEDLTVAGTPTAPEAYAAFKTRQNPPFLFPLGEPPKLSAALAETSGDRQPPLQERYQLLEQMRPVYFFRAVAPSAIDWHVNALENKRGDRTRTWCELPDFIPEQGDMRMLWEPSRAAFAIDIAKACSREATIDAAELYWRWLDSWMESSPPYLGFQWKCGQESSVRLIALALGFWSVGRDPATTPDRWVQFARMAWATGYRVAHHINYAISQKNNHSMSEAVGLMMISLLFPEFKEAAAWWEKGRRTLEWDIPRQVSADGTYLQSSMNYERVMLQVCMLGVRLSELAGQPMERGVYDVLDRCKEFLFQCMDPETGRLPNYGSNDGAYVLPLSECDFTDFRPAIQAAHFLVHRRRLLKPGPWDEDLAWLFGAKSLESEIEPSRSPVSSAFRTGGYFTIRADESWAMTRCHTYQYRPGHCDQLHLDLWWRGQNVLKDCGSYHYYVPGRPDIEFYFKSVQAHNTIELDGRNYVESGGRFLWFPWPRARERVFDTGSAIKVFEGEHLAYDRSPWNVLHRRTTIALPGSSWVVIDDLLGNGSHRAVLRWHMMDAPVSLHATKQHVELTTPKGTLNVQVISSAGPAQRFEVIRARSEEGRFQGFASPYYSELQPAPTIEAEYDTAVPLRIVTVVSPNSAEPVLQDTPSGRELQLKDAGVIKLGALDRETPRVFLGYVGRTAS